MMIKAVLYMGAAGILAVVAATVVALLFRLAGADLASENGSPLLLETIPEGFTPSGVTFWDYPVDLGYVRAAPLRDRIDAAQAAQILRRRNER